MKNADKRKIIALWAQAGEALAADPTAKVVCPTCGLGVLQVDDRTIWNESRIERWMRCDHCNTANAVILSPSDEFIAKDSGAAERGTSGGEINLNDEESVQKLVTEAAIDIFRKRNK
jgi:hypothetical protein